MKFNPKKTPYFLESAHGDSLSVYEVERGGEKRPGERHYSFEMGCVTKGQGTLLLENQSISLKAESAFLFNGAIPHQYISESKQLLKMDIIHLSYNSLHCLTQPESHIAAFDTLNHPLSHVVDKGKKAGLKIKKIKNYLHNKTDSSVIDAWGSAISLMAFFVDKVGPMNDYARKNQGKYIQTAIDYIGNHFKENISIEDIARNSFCSTSSLAHQFKEVMRFSPIEYRNILRMQKAERHLVANKEKIEKISSRCGFSNETIFRRLFKRYSGYTPSEYRNKFSNHMEY